jgi:hypothetical protein
MDPMDVYYRENPHFLLRRNAAERAEIDCGSFFIVEQHLQVFN